MSNSLTKVIGGVVFATVVFCLAGCGSGGSGDTAVAPATPAVITEANNKVAYDKAVLPLNDVYARYKDAEKIAASTPRIALGTPISNMQTLKRETDALVVAK